MRSYLLASTLISRRPIRAFDTGNYMPAARPGTVNIGLIRSLMAAAVIAADQGTPQTTKDDLGARDIDSEYMLCYWDKVDDIVAGHDAIKAKATAYLPKFHDETDAAYNNRLSLTEFTNVFRDICESLAGKPFEEEIALVTEKDETTGDEIPLPDTITEFVEDVDGAGNNLTSFAATSFFNGIVSAIDWIYVDYPVVDREKIKTQQDMKDNNIRPFWSHVLGRNVLSAKVAIIDGKEILVYMRILEPGTPNHIRVFERYPNDNKVLCGLFVEKVNADKTREYSLIETTEITIGEIPLTPFATGRRDGRTFKFEPAMRDAADLQIQLYRQESGLNFAKTMTAYPILAGNGIKPMKGPDNRPLPISISPSRVLYSEPDGAGNHGSWAYVSPDAACLTFLKDDIKETMDQLRELGRQPLTAQSGNLTVITTAYAAGKSKTAVGAWALRLKDTLENAMRLSCLWLDIKNFEPEITIFDEYDDFTSDQTSDMSALQYANSNGKVSDINYRRELKRRGIIRADFDEQENIRQLLDQTPSDNSNVQDDGADNPSPSPQPQPKPNPKKNMKAKV